jgi:exonuclease SbcC
MQKFVPDCIPTELPNLVYIEGPNSSGKSTLLSIIALGLYGIKSTRLHPALLDKMSLLLDSDYQKLKFLIEITSESGDLVIKSKKSNLHRSEIVLEESVNGKPFKPLSFESFENKYNLIYDIPSNPAERLYDLLKELKEEQLNYGNRFKEFGWYLHNTITDVTNYRDPKRLEEVSEGLRRVKNDKEKITGELPQLQDFLDSLEKHAYVKLYCYYLNESVRLQNEKNDLEEKSRKLGKGEKEISSKLTRFRNNIATLQGEFSVKYNEVTPLIGNALPKNEISRLKIWKKINPYGAESNELSTVKAQTIHFVDLFGREFEKLQAESSYKDAAVLQRIIQALKEFEDSSLVIPKIKVTLRDLISILKDENKKNYVLISRFENLTRIMDLLGNLKESVDGLQEKLEEARKISTKGAELSDEYVQSYYQQKSQLKILSNALEGALSKRDYYLQKCLSKGIDKKHLEGLSYFELVQTLPKKEELKPFLSLSEKQIEEKIAELEKEMLEKREKLKSFEIYIEQYQKEKDRLEKQRPHKYEKYRDELEFLLKKTEATSQKLLSEYNSNMKLLVERKVEKGHLVGEAKRRYYEEVSKYLANRIGFFRHIDTIYKAKIVDLISGIIITDDNVTIHIADMGTGQSQSAYIMSLLNAKNDNRRIIALFDEIAMMDERSLEPIYEKMQELYRKKRLVVGIMVQKGNKVNIKSLVQ